ncbi:conserved hypothetical protein [Brugia malayi]|uniref:Bm9107 n=1 Tax=Brugia malayi TaxID=6279 RepID=A0A4E9FJT7_BRUMA|nr:uncharacterized protein BM_BM9107 [Brugia malayi]VIO95110.1 conserved hypothetical protein [Brugia malayi]
MNDRNKHSIRSPAWKNPCDVIKKGIRKNRQHFKKIDKNLQIRGLSVSSSSSPSSSLKQLSVDNEADERFSVLSTKILQGADSVIINPFRRVSCKRSLNRNTLPEKIIDDRCGVSSTVVDLIADSNALQEFPSSVFDKVKKISMPKDTEARSSTSVSTSTTSTTVSLPVDFSSIDEFSCSTPKKKTLRVEESKTKVDSLPVDLRLGLKLRLESPKRFFWLEKSKGIAAYDDAIKLFCSLQTGANEIAMETTERSVSDLSKFLACTLYWQFPDLAWQPSFPRLDNDSRLIGVRNPVVPSLHTLGDPLVQALTMQWFLSLEQLYHSWLFGTRQYFYACCPTYTILFWKTPKGTVELDEHLSKSDEKYNFQVVITPTTYGFRQQLREDGIKYSMPLRHSRYSSSRHSILNDNSLLGTTQSQPPLISDNKKEQSWVSSDSSLSGKRDDFILISDSKENQVENDEERKNEKNDKGSESPDDLNSSNDTDNDEWLRGIGISPRKTLKITRNKSVMSSHSLDYERSFSLDPDFTDENKKSAIVLKDLDSIAALYNMMTTSNFGRVATGPQAGFPPTLLARQPFLNAVLKNLKCQYRDFTKDGADFYVCEWENGPIMPHMITMLENFLRHNSKLDQETSIVGQISGRFKCPGMNDAAGLDEMANFSSFEFRLGSFFKQ